MQCYMIKYSNWTFCPGYIIVKPVEDRTPLERSFWKNSEDPSEKPQNTAFHQGSELFAKTKMIPSERNTTTFEHFNL